MAAAPERFDRVPVLVELGRYNARERRVEDLVVAACARVVEGESRRRHHKPPAVPLVDDAARVVPAALADGRLCVFLDGLDEVVTDRRGDVAVEPVRCGGVGRPDP